MSDLTRDEMVEILERIAREGSDGLRIQAIRVLLSIDAGAEPEEDELERILRTK